MRQILLDNWHPVFKALTLLKIFSRMTAALAAPVMSTSVSRSQSVVTMMTILSILTFLIGIGATGGGCIETNTATSEGIRDKMICQVRTMS
jgi:hypothetical protein